MKVWNVPPLWKDGECFIIGGGKSMPYQFNIPESIIEAVCSGNQPPSVYSPYMSCLHDKHVIGTNNAFMLGDWIDFLLFVDNSWYDEYRLELRKWPGIKVSCAPKFVNKPDDTVKFLKKDTHHLEGISPDITSIAWNKNSGGAAISLAHHLGVKRVYLLGFDMKAIDPRYTHWHGIHYFKHKGEKLKLAAGKLPSTGSPYPRHLKGFPAIARDAKKMGIEIINLCPESAITEFPKMNLKDILPLENS